MRRLSDFVIAAYVTVAAIINGYFCQILAGVIQMKLTYLRWRDAAFSVEERHLSDTGLIELEEFGFLAGETEEKVTLAMEKPGDESTVRLWLSVPKVNIVERREFELEDLLSRRKKQTRRKRTDEPIATADH